MKLRPVCAAGLAATLCAGLAAGSFAFAAGSTTDAGQKAVTNDKPAATQAGTMQKADDETSEPREIKVAEGLSDEDAAAVEKGLTCNYMGVYYDNLKDAMTMANQNGGGTVTLLADTVSTNDLDEVPTIGFRTSIIVKSAGDESLSVYRAEGQTGPLRVITDGSGEQATASIITISDQAVVTFNKGFEVCGNVTDCSEVAENVAASAVSVSGPDAVLKIKEGASIHDCTGTGDVLAALVTDRCSVENGGIVFENNAVEGDTGPDYEGDARVEGEKLG
jgi:hypothetical protein